MNSSSVLSLALTTLLGAELASGQCTVAHLPGPSASPSVGLAPSFGTALSVANGRVLVGSLYDSIAGQYAGAAFVYERTANGFSRETLLPQTPQYDGRFGESVAMVGDQALVGALDDEFGDAAGAVFVHERTPAGWQVVQKLTASDAHAGGNFGVAMQASGERIVVGASGDGVDPGSAYVFERQGGVWTEVDVLRPTTTLPYTAFGGTVSIDGSRVVVGSYGSTTFPLTAGAAFVFEDAGGAWVQTDRLSPAGLDGLDFVSNAVAVHRDRIVVGAPGENWSSANTGAAYVYELDQGVWTQVARLTGTLVSRSAFGVSIDLDEERIAIGAGPSWLSASVVKTVETFRGSGANWTSEGHTIGNGGGFGSSVELWNGAVLAGGDTNGTADSVRLINVAREAQLFGGHGEISFSAQEEQALLISTCANLAGAPYRVLGSLDGAGAFVAGGAVVPIGFDRYARQTVVNPGLTLVGGTGTLDGAGRASASVRMAGAAQSVFVGRTLYHAAVVLDGAGAPVIASNQVAVRIVP